MHLESKRVFISDLPEELTNEDVTKRFSQYGTVSTVEIKERKDLGPKNNSRFFAFINIDIDAGNLQKCFQEIPSKKWKGNYVQLQLARENFLDRLKKERAEAKLSPTSTSITNESSTNTTTQNNFYNSNIKVVPVAKGTIESDSDSSTSEEEEEADATVHIKKEIKQASNKKQFNGVPNTETFEYPDIIYKHNNSKIVNNKLVIESVGNKPIYTSTSAKSKSLDPKRTEADQKRLQSMLEKKQGFNRQKFVIKSALSKIDVAANIDGGLNKVKEVDSSISVKSSRKPNLFENEDADEDEYNFGMKKQYEGPAGQKLLALQSNYKNDTRFTLDERFMDQQEEDLTFEESNSEDDLIVEKKKEYEIMEEVLGTKIVPCNERQNNKLMLRFDPNQPKHSKYEIKEADIEAKTTKKRKKEKVEVVLPEVSQETFFDVDGKLKDALQEKSSFSLLGTFAEPSQAIEEDQDYNEESSTKIHKKNSLLHTQNPFKYDSSDDENQTEVIENIKSKKSKKMEKTNSATVSLGAKKLWTETLFFKDDDYRFQDGMEFVMKLGTDETSGISDVRQEIKQIVRAKVRNNKGKDKMFKRKLGGQKKFKYRKGNKKY